MEVGTEEDGGGAGGGGGGGLPGVLRSGAEGGSVWSVFGCGCLFPRSTLYFLSFNWRDFLSLD